MPDPLLFKSERHLQEWKRNAAKLRIIALRTKRVGSHTPKKKRNR